MTDRPEALRAGPTCRADTGRRPLGDACRAQREAQHPQRPRGGPAIATSPPPATGQHSAAAEPAAATNSTAEAIARPSTTGPQSGPGQPAGQALAITTDAPVHNTSSPAAASAHPLPLRHKNPSYPRADRKGAWGTTARTRFTPAIRSRDPKTPKGFTTRAHLDHSSTNNFRRLSEQCNHRWRHLQQEKKSALVRSFARPNNTVLGVRGSTTDPR